MKLRLPSSLHYAVLNAVLPAAVYALAIAAPAHAESASASTWEELTAAITSGKLDIELSEAVFNVPSISPADINSGLTFSGLAHFTGVGQGKTVFRGAAAAGQDISNRAFNYEGGWFTIEHCTFENFFNSVVTTKSYDHLRGSVIGGGGGFCTLSFVDFINNRAEVYSTTQSTTAYGGVTSFGDRRAPSTITDCNFTGNSLASTSMGTESYNSAYATGGAIMANGYGDPMGSVMRSKFIGNHVEATAFGSAQAMAGALAFDGIVANCTFSGNYATAVSTKDGGTAMASGGAMNTQSGYKQGRVVDNCLFEFNYTSAQAATGTAYARGGAVVGVPYMKDCDFLNNYTLAAKYSQGGAIFANCSYGDGLQACMITISAIDKDSVFRGNRVQVTQVDPVTGKPLDGIANAIATHPEWEIPQNGKIYTYTNFASTIDFQAAAGRSVYFYDPVVIQIGMDIRENSPNFPVTQSLGFNTSEPGGTAYEGRIVFTGEDFAATDNPENWTTRLYYNLDMRLYGGSLVIRDKAVVGAPNLLPDDYFIPEGSGYNTEIGPKSFTMDKGTLEITGKGHLLARKVVIEGGHEASTFRTGTGAMLTAQTVDISRGVSFDFAPFLDGRDSGLSIKAASVTLGGIMGISDTLDYYADRRWASAQEYTALSFTPETAAALGGTDFTGIISLATGSPNVESPYTYQGYWAKEWRDSDGDGIADKLYAVWTPTGGITDIDPEQAGDATLNDLWSDISNMQAMSDVALAQIGVNRYKLQHCSNYWVNTIGDFDMHRSAGGRDGYDYNGFGYAVGADFRITCPDTWLVGVAFGNLYGKNKSRSFFAETKQTTYIGMIYGGYYKEYNPANALNVTASASWGTTRNRMRTFYRDGGHSEGKWNSRAMRYTLRCEWIRTLDTHWNLVPFLGLEYDDARQSSFSETGDKARRFGKGNLRNLAMPVGIGLWRSDTFDSGRVWINGVELSYAPDVYRENPKASAGHYVNDFTWTARGVETSRHAGRASYTTRIVWNRTWSTFAGYEIEWRKNAVYQQANIGMSASF